MLNRLYFSRCLKFLLRERRDVLSGRGNFEFVRILMQKSEHNAFHTHRFLWTRSNVLYPNVTVQARCQTIPLVLNLRYYQKGSSSTAKSLRQRLWTVVRGVFLATGGLVWLVVFTAYVSLDKVTVDVVENDNKSGASTLQQKLAQHFYKEKNEAGILRKENALDSVWRKLSQEEEIKAIFGEPVFICGFNYKFMSDARALSEQGGNVENNASQQQLNARKTKEQVEQENEIQENDVERLDDSEWNAGCYIEGPKKMGVMNVKFEKHKQEWVPVALHVETLDKTGHVVSNVSAPLPNGIKNFTRLSN